MSKIAVRASKLAGLFALTLSVAAPTLAASNSFASQFPARILAVHNAVRARAGQAPLVWDPALGQAAAAYAQQMAFTGVFAHSDRQARRGTGENLWRDIDMRALGYEVANSVQGERAMHVFLRRRA